MKRPARELLTQRLDHGILVSAEGEDLFRAAVHDCHDDEPAALGRESPLGERPTDGLADYPSQDPRSPLKVLRLPVQDTALPADILGVTVEQYQTMSAAADQAGVGVEKLTRVSERLVGLLQQARDGSGAAVEKLKGLGISTEQIASSTFGVNDALGILHAGLTASATAQTEQNRLLADFGPRGATAIEVLKRYSGSQAEVAATMERVNGLTKAQVDSAASLYADYKEFGTYLANTFTKALDSSTEGISRFFDVALAPAAKSVALQTTIQVPSIAPQVKADAGQAQAALQEITVTAKALSKTDLDDIRERVSTERQGSAERLAAMRELYNASLQFYGSAQTDKVREAARQLAAEQRAYAAEQIRNIEQVNQKTLEAARIKQREVSEELADDKRYLDEQRSIAFSGLEAEMQAARLALEARVTTLDAEVTARKITAAQWLSETKELYTQLAALDVQELERKKQLYATEPAEAAKAAGQIVVVRAKLNADLAKLDKQAAADNARQVKEQATEWSKAVGEIESAEGSLIGDLLSKRRSLSQSLLQMSGQLVQQEIVNDTKAMTTRLLLANTEEAQKKALEQGGFLYHLLFETQKTSATATQQAARNTAVAAGAATQETTQASAAVTSEAIQSATGVAQVLSDAAVAAAGAAASVAAIPGVGWAMAPEVGAATYAEVASYASLASLDTGTMHVPQTGLYQLHRGEAVTPKPWVQGMREAAAAGGPSGAGAGSHKLNVEFIPVGADHGLVRMSDLATTLKRMNQRFQFA